LAVSAAGEKLMELRMGGKGRSIAGVHQPKAITHNWITPRFVIDDLGKFDLDPCACVDQPWPCASRSISPPDDGLAADWGGARVWCNPPYNDLAALWLERMAQHGHGMALIFARTDTDMFHEWVWPRAAALLFLRGRLFFHFGEPFVSEKTGQRFDVGDRAPHNSGGPSVLVAYGRADADRLKRSSLSGHYVDLEKN
jgi:hypothetical protein